MTVSVDLTVARSEHALVIPSEAVRDAATSALYAFAWQGRRLVRRALKLGIRGDGDTEVIDGLADGELVALPNGRAQKAGQRARADVAE